MTPPPLPLPSRPSLKQQPQRQPTSPPTRSTISPYASPLKSLLSGGIAGMVAKTIVAPLDRIKILFQVTHTTFKLTHLPVVIKTIVNEEGFWMLWKGNGTTMLRVFPYAGVQFMVYDVMKHYFEENSKDGKMSGSQSLVSGSTAGALSTVVTYPLDLTRARLAVLKNKKFERSGANSSSSSSNSHSSSSHPKGFRQTLKLIYTSQGVPGMYRGITPTLLGMIPYAGIAFTMNDYLKNFVKEYREKNQFDDNVTVYDKLICGGLSGLVAQSLTYPLDVTRRRMQVVGLVKSGEGVSGIVDAPKFLKTSSNSSSSSSTSIKSSSTMTQTIKYLYAEQGLRGLYKGLTMNWIKGPMAFAVSFTMFDFIKGNLDYFAFFSGDNGFNNEFSDDTGSNYTGNRDNLAARAVVSNDDDDSVRVVKRAGVDAKIMRRVTVRGGRKILVDEDEEEKNIRLTTRDV